MSELPDKTSAECGSVSIWLDRLPEGDQEAQNALLIRYRDRLEGYAGYRLRQMGVRSKDSDDIAQEVFMSLFRRAKAGTIGDLNNRDQLWLKLRRIAGDRVKDARRKNLPFTESAVDPGNESNLVSGVVRREDTQVDECLLMVEHELVHRILAERHPDLPAITSLKVHGFTVEQIANRMNLPKRTIERRLAWIYQICDEYCRL